MIKLWQIGIQFAVQNFFQQNLVLLILATSATKDYFENKQYEDLD